MYLCIAQTIRGLYQRLNVFTQRTSNAPSSNENIYIDQLLAVCKDAQLLYVFPVSMEMGSNIINIHID